MRSKIQRINDLTNGPVFVRFCFGDGGGGDGGADVEGYGDDMGSEDSMGGPGPAMGGVGDGSYSAAVSDALGDMDDSPGGAGYGDDSEEGGYTADDSPGGAGYGDDSEEGGYTADDSPGGAGYGDDSEEGGYTTETDNPLDSMTFDDDRLDERDVEDYSQEEQNLWGKQLTDEERSLLQDITHAKGKQNFSFDLDEDVAKAMDSRKESTSLVGNLLGTTSIGTIANMLADFNAQNLDTSPAAAATRGNTLSGMVNNPDLAEALDSFDNVNEGAGGDADDFPATGGQQSVNAKTVAARKNSFPQNWFPPGTDYNAVFIDDDGSVKTNAEVEESLVEAWQAHGQAGGSGGDSTGDVWGTDINVSDLVGAGAVAGTLRNFYESGKYGRFASVIEALGGNPTLLAPEHYRQFDTQYDEEHPFLAPGWQDNMPFAQYVEVNPGLSQHWDQFVKGMAGQSMDSSVQLHPNLTNEQVLDYWQDLVGKDTFTKEEFGQAHMEQEGGEHSLGRGRKLFNWSAPNAAPVTPPVDEQPAVSGNNEQPEHFSTALPPASSFVTPPVSADAAGSGVSTTALEEVRNTSPYSPTEGVNYLVPVRDRYTGRIRYVPQGMAGSFNQPMWGATSTGPGVYSYPSSWRRWGRVATPAAAYPASSRRAGWGSITRV